MAEGVMRFKLPEENGEFRICMRAVDFYSMIIEIRKIIRDYEKYETPKTAEEVLDVIKEEVYSINTDDIP